MSATKSAAAYYAGFAHRTGSAAVPGGVARRLTRKAGVDAGAPARARRRKIVAEKAALDRRLARLRAFTAGYVSNEFLALPVEQRRLLRMQDSAMAIYSAILDSRIRLLDAAAA